MKSKDTTLVTVILLGIITLALLGGWIFLGFEANVFKKEIKVLQTESQNKTTLNTYLTSVRGALRDSKSDLAIIKNRFITKDNVPEFINLLENKAQTSGVKADLTGITIETLDNARGILRVKITGSGGWEQVTRFISILDSLPYAAKIGGITMMKSQKKIETPSTTNEAPEPIVWAFTIELSQYIQGN